MNISTISYWFYEAFESMKKNKKNVIISFTTMIATMIIIAIGYTVLMNASFIIEQKQEVNSKVMAFLEIDVTDDEKNNIETRLWEIEGVTDVEFFSQEESIKKASEMDEMFTYAFTEEQLKEMYPPFFRVSFDSIEAEKLIVSTLKSLPGVGQSEEDVGVTDSAVKAIKVAKSIRIIALLAMILIIELSVFLMINSTKLTLYARRKEISIMKYVGAKDNFVKMPFAIEGILIAVAAALVVMLIVVLCYESMIGAIAQGTNYRYLELSEVMDSLKWILLGVGALIGAFGTTISMNKYLDV